MKRESISSTPLYQVFSVLCLYSTCLFKSWGHGQHTSWVSEHSGVHVWSQKCNFPLVRFTAVLCTCVHMLTQLWAFILTVSLRSYGPLLLSLILHCTLFRVTFVQQQLWEECVLILYLWPLLLQSLWPETHPAFHLLFLSPSFVLLGLVCTVP